MSATTLKAIWPGERSVDLHHLDNSDLAAPVIWKAMQAKYLFRRNWSSTTEHLKGIWVLPGLPDHHRAVLAMTSDYSIISQDDYSRAAADIRAWLADFGSPAGHWNKIADSLESKPECPAVGLCLTDARVCIWGPEQIDWCKAWDIYKIMAKHYCKDTDQLTNIDGKR